MQRPLHVLWLGQVDAETLTMGLATRLPVAAIVKVWLAHRLQIGPVTFFGRRGEEFALNVRSERRCLKVATDCGFQEC